MKNETEESDENKTILGYFMLIFGIVLFISGFVIEFGFNKPDIVIKKVDCFDKYGNKINGVICDEEVDNYKPLSQATAFLSAYGMILAFSSIIPFHLRSWEI